MLNLIVQLISGAVGGNAAGSLMKDKSLGTAGNSIVGILGGGIGGQLLGLVGLAQSSGGGVDIGSIISDIAGGGVGGGVLLLIISVIKKAMAK